MNLSADFVGVRSCPLGHKEVVTAIAVGDLSLERKDLVVQELSLLDSFLGLHSLLVGLRRQA